MTKPAGRYGRRVLAFSAVAFAALALMVARLAWDTSSAPAGSQPQLSDEGPPKAVATPAPGEGQGGDTDRGRPGNPGYLKAEPSLAGNDLHLTFFSYDYSPLTPDPNNGVILVNDVWMSLDSAGIPTLLLGRYSTVDGRVVQTIAQDRTTSDVRFDPPRRSGHPDGSLACRLEFRSSAADLATTVPAFVAFERLAEAGFRPGGAFTIVPPSPPAGTGATHTYPAGPGENFERTGKVDRDSGWTSRQTLSVDPASGRIVGWHATTSTPLGALYTEHWESYGSLEVLASGTIPAAPIFLKGGPCQ